MIHTFEAVTHSLREAGPGIRDELRVEIVSDLAAFQRLRPQLELLCEDLCEENVFYEPWMVEPALTHLTDGQRIRFLYFFNVGPARRLCGFFPLILGALHPLLPIPVYRAWRHPHCFRCIPLIRTGFAEACWEALLEWLGGHTSIPPLLRLYRLPADGEVERALQSVLEKRPLVRRDVHSYESAFLRIASDSERVLRQAMSAVTRQKLRRQQRRLSELGALTFSDADEKTDLVQLVNQFLQLETNGWKGRDRTALASKHQEEAFFRSAISTAMALRRLSFLSMQLNGKLIASQSSLLGRSGSFLFKTAYDENYRKFSPGILLEIEHLRRMHDPRDPRRGKLRWSDSCAGPEDGPVYRCWPETRTIRSYNIACHLGPSALIVALLPLLRRFRWRQWTAPRAKKK